MSRYDDLRAMREARFAAEAGKPVKQTETVRHGGVKHVRQGSKSDEENHGISETHRSRASHAGLENQRLKAPPKNSPVESRGEGRKAYLREYMRVYMRKYRAKAREARCSPSP
jgi:hypothetical protein